MPIADRLLSKRRLAYLGAFSVGALGIWSGHNYVRSDEFGLQQTMGIVSSEILSPGFYVNAPYPFQYTHSYKLSTQRIEFNAGSCRFIPTCENTQDRNALMADIVLTYKVIPDAKKISMRPWSMESWGRTDGYWLITNLMNESANAVFGQKSMQGAYSDPENFLNKFKQNFVDRLDQNNVPIEILRIELRDFHTSYLAPARIVTQNSTTNIPSPTGVAPR